MVGLWCAPPGIGGSLPSAFNLDQEEGAHPWLWVIRGGGRAWGHHDDLGQCRGARWGSRVEPRVLMVGGKILYVVVQGEDEGGRTTKRRAKLVEAGTVRYAWMAYGEVKEGIKFFRQ